MAADEVGTCHSVDKRHVLQTGARTALEIACDVFAQILSSYNCA